MKTIFLQQSTDIKSRNCKLAIEVAVNTCLASELFWKLIPNARNKEYHHGQYRRIQNLPGNEISSDVRYILHLVTATLVEFTRGFLPDMREISDYFFRWKESHTPQSNGGV